MWLLTLSRRLDVGGQELDRVPIATIGHAAAPKTDDRADLCDKHTCAQQNEAHELESFASTHRDAGVECADAASCYTIPSTEKRRDKCHSSYGEANQKK